MLKMRWPCYPHAWDVVRGTWEETPDTQSTSAASGETWERFLFPGFSHVVSQAQEIPGGTPGGECYRAVIGLLFSIYTHCLGDSIQLYGFKFLLSPTATFISSLPLSSKLRLPINHHQMHHVQTELLTYLRKHISFAVFPIPSWWSLHFPDAWVRCFSLILDPVSLIHNFSPIRKL